MQLVRSEQVAWSERRVPRILVLEPRVLVHPIFDEKEFFVLLPRSGVEACLFFEVLPERMFLATHPLQLDH